MSLAVHAASAVAPAFNATFYATAAAVIPVLAIITVTGSAEQAKPENETWWQRWRKRGLIIGLATVVAAVAAVLQLYGWVPWK